MITLGRFIQVPLREVWAREDHHFTQWLALPENLQELSDTIGVELYEAQTEVAVGRFFVDILAEDEAGRKVVIENQLEATDHDHLGKTITYAAGLEAQVVVWIVESAKEEHRQAVDWLNEHTTSNANFFLLQIEAWRIGDSLPAPRFNVIAKPNDWAKEVKQSAAGGQASATALKQQEFYELVREYGAEHARHIRRWQTPSAQHWYDIAIGSSQAHIALTVNSLKKRVAVELYINDNKALFEHLLGHRTAIESQLGYPLDWRELIGKKASRIVVEKPGDFISAAEQAQLVEWMASTADEFSRVFPSFVKSFGAAFQARPMVGQSPAIQGATKPGGAVPRDRSEESPGDAN